MKVSAKLFQELGEINVLSNDEAKSRGLDPENTEGLYHKSGERRGDVDIFFENIIGFGDERRATDRLVEVLWHEAIGHKGLIEGLNSASKDGKGYDRFIDSFIEQNKNNEESNSEPGWWYINAKYVYIKYMILCIFKYTSHG